MANRPGPLGKCQGGHLPRQADARNLGKDRYTSNGRDIFELPGQPPNVDASITQKENADLKEYQEIAIQQLSLEDLNLPNRPDFGKNGAPVILRANLFELTLSDGQHLFPYKVDVDQRLHKSNRQLRYFFQTILRRLPSLRPMGDGIATDYASLLVTSAKIELGPTDRQTFTMPYYDGEFREDRVQAGARGFEFTFSLLQPISSSDLSRYIGSSPAILNESESANNDVVRALNVVISGHPNKDPGVYQGGQGKLFRYPSSKSEASPYDLQGGLIGIRGYFYSVRFATLRVLLNVHGQCAPFYKAINARELMQEFEDLVGGKRNSLESFFKMLRVKTLYTEGPNNTPITKIRTVVGISPGNADNTRFKRRGDQSEATIKYGMNLEYRRKPVLNCGTAIRPVWIPAELCTVMPGQRYLGDLSDSQRARMITIAVCPPAENARRIVAGDEGLGLVGVLPQRCKTLTSFGITVDPKMVVVPGRVLDPPKLMYGGSASFTARGGVWNMNGKRFLKPAIMPSWTLLRIGAAANIPIASLASQLKALRDGFTECGLKGVGPGPSVDLPQATNGELGINRTTVDESLEKIFKENKEKGINMFVVILPSEDPWLFARVKYWGDVKYGIHTSCVQLNKLRKANVNISANVSLKVNLKLGGTNQGIYPPDLGFLANGNTMIVGIDVTHPEHGSIQGTPSIAGIVASIDADFTQWPGNIRCQERRKEMVSDLEMLMEERLRLWVSNNRNHKLENIIIYRDGVSEGQHKTVLREEVPAIRKACTKVLVDSPQPKITLIIVVRRHHNRFFPTDKKEADPSHNNNIRNGTVVDRGVTMIRRWDFFMAPHVALQGTTKPAHYIVLLDDIRDRNKLAADHLEKITHNLCYLHGTTTFAVSICPPAYYADQICERGRCYIADYLGSNKSARKEYNANDAPWHEGVHERHVVCRFWDSPFFPEQRLTDPRAASKIPCSMSRMNGDAPTSPSANSTTQRLRELTQRIRATPVPKGQEKNNKIRLIGFST